MTPGHHALPHQVSESYKAARHLKAPIETSSGTDITSPATAKQLRNSDSSREICVADIRADDSKLRIELQTPTLLSHCLRCRTTPIGNDFRYPTVRNIARIVRQAFPDRVRRWRCQDHWQHKLLRRRPASRSTRSRVLKSSQPRSSARNHSQQANFIHLCRRDPCK